MNDNNRIRIYSSLFLGVLLILTNSCMKDDLFLPVVFTTISACGDHSLALEPDGTLWAWGGNYYGQLGDGTNVDKNKPVKIGPGYVAVSACSGHSLALKTDGTLWSWGYNNFGQLGDGTLALYRNTPAQIATGYASNGAGISHSKALKTDGTLWGWGYDRTNGFYANHNKPVQISPGYVILKTKKYFGVITPKNSLRMHMCGMHLDC